MRRDSDIFDSENIRIDNADRRCFSNCTEIVSFENSMRCVFTHIHAAVEKRLPNREGVF